MNQGDQWEQVKSFYAAASELPAGEREGWLESNCTDPVVRREVRELLAADHEATGWLSDGPELGAAAPALPPDLEGRRVGRFDVVQRIDSGGMGAVYLARVVDDGREVALKVIQRGLVTDAAVARFLREREILARLDHPGVCPMLDSGTTADGRPFLVMPFLEDARPITDYCHDHDLDVRERARLIMAVCQAVQHAHQNLVVHSDLKPGNVLVTANGCVQLVDFGISRLLAPGHEELTRRFRERRPATLDYAAPEQLRGDSPSTLSDIYSLGALLYQVLTGEKAYRVATGEEPAQRASAAEPPRSRDLSLDLYNICCKAMQHEPAQRYGSAAALAEDLECWLADRPVSARAPSTRYRMAKFVRRNTWPVVAAGTAALAVMVLAVVLAVNNARISAQAERIAQERDRAEATADFWAHLFEQTDPVRAEATAPSVDELLERALDELTAGDSPLPAATRARLLGVISTSFWNLAAHAQARTAADAAFAAGQQGGVDAATRALAAKQLANIAMAQGDAEAARTAADTALAAMADAESLSALDRSQILDAHALVLEMEGRVEDAAAVMEEVVAIQQHLPLDEVIVSHATAWGNLAFMYFTLARKSDQPEPLFARAAEGVERSLALLRQALGEGHPRVGFMLNASGALNLERGRLQAALADFRAAADIADQTLPPGHEMLAHLHYNVGTLHRRLGQHGAAAQAFELAWTASAGFADEHPHRYRSLIGTVRAHLVSGQHDSARRWLAELERLVETLGPDHATALWHEVLSRQLAGRPLPEPLLARSRASEDAELIEYLDVAGGGHVD